MNTTVKVSTYLDGMTLAQLKEFLDGAVRMGVPENCVLDVEFRDDSDLYYSQKRHILTLSWQAALGNQS